MANLVVESRHHQYFANELGDRSSPQNIDFSPHGRFSLRIIDFNEVFAELHLHNGG